MGGGLMQLVAYGAQDIYLTGNPQITFFKVVYRRYTNFSMECIQQTFNGTASANSLVSATIARNGDLVHDSYIKFMIQKSTFDSAQQRSNLGYSLINNIEVEIGGQVIDRQTGYFLEAYSELTQPSFNATQETMFRSSRLLKEQLFTINGSNTLSPFQITTGSGGVTDYNFNRTNINVGFNLYVPLQFWFNRNVGLSLPLIALQYHEVNININFSAVYGFSTDLGTIQSELWCNYIYLDTDERRRFAQVSHEYLIEQVQSQIYNKNIDTTLSINLVFNHPVKELIWGLVQGPTEWDDNKYAGNLDGNAPLAPTGYPLLNKGSKIVLKLNGQDRFEPQELTYFTRYQPMKYHTGIGKTTSLDTIGVYSFALKPEEHQPSGTCNFSRIDTAQLYIEKAAKNPGNINIYAINYNVLRIMSGMGGLAYSN